MSLRPRSYAVQYRETDLAFIERLFAEEGLGYAFVEDEAAPQGHSLVIFGDSAQLPEDASSASDPSGAGIRFHRVAAVEESDTIQYLGQSFHLAPGQVTLLSHDYKPLAATAASAVVRGGAGQREAYDPVGEYGELGILRANVEGHVAVLVRGERDAAGQKGFQIGLGVPNDTVPNTTAYKFFWAADGTPNDASRPAMEVSLTIQPEDDKPASFADAKQAQALWDELLQGLRIRPGSVAR